MDLRGSINVWKEHDGSVSIFSTNDDEPGALGYKQSQECGVLLFELTVRRIIDGADERRRR